MLVCFGTTRVCLFDNHTHTTMIAPTTDKIECTLIRFRERSCAESINYPQHDSGRMVVGRLSEDCAPRGHGAGVAEHPSRSGR